MSVERILWEEDATGLAGLVRKGELSATELTDAAIARAEATRPEINATAEPLYEAARARAKGIDRSLPLAGVPFAIKDLAIAIKGVPSHGGSRIPASVPQINSVMTERYLAAGLIPIVTSTSPEHGLRLMTESKVFGITRNPWNTGHTSGGSSGGAAALVAAGVVPVAHASDGGGSIRVPSACTGLVGLKTSRGRVPLTPLVSESWYGMVVDHAVTRSVRDCALLLDLTHGPDALSPYAALPPRGRFTAAAARDPGKLSLAVYRKSPLGLPISAETMKALDIAVALAREGGHAVEDIDLPFIGRDFFADFCRTVASAVAGTLRAEALRVGRSVTGDIERATRVLGRLGEMVSAGEVYAGLQRLHAASRRLIEETARYDAVLMPVIAHPPLACGAMDPKGADELIENLLDKLHLTPLLKLKPLFGQLMDKSLFFTHWPAIQNVSGQPSIALPVHVTEAGLPLGIQAAGRPGDEETLLSFAAQMEKISGWLGRRAPLMVPSR
ncbi:amidase [Mesorhizobium erdmanii]|uniref:Indoleacetamide hydrolase n=1 Tax=Mesorhizobium erdmanii TaxID=1777866 RepID=A0A6M7UF68_9HYPH|nr:MULTISPECIES: amidase [Mesorhizobium]OBQ67307.1 6-aminohexanoate hydrolase [Mesorhizobium loti]QKC74683.1 amidase [Mesorhizobium erdmanii]